MSISLSCAVTLDIEVALMALTIPSMTFDMEIMIWTF